jgi:hypothetical protein
MSMLITPSIESALRHVNKSCSRVWADRAVNTLKTQSRPAGGARSGGVGESRVRRKGLTVSGASPGRIGAVHPAGRAGCSLA